MREAVGLARQGGVSDDIDSWMERRWSDLARQTEESLGARLSDPDQLQEIAPVEPGAASDTSSPEPMDIGLRFQKARPGANISSLIGSSDPRAVGKFLSLNGMDASSSTIRPGRSYIVPTRWDDATDGEVRAGRSLLGMDNARLQTRAEESAARARRRLALERQSEWFSQGRNIFTGEPVDAGRPVGPAPSSPTGRRSTLDDNKVAKAAAGTLGWGLGLAPGALRGLYHTGKGGLEGAHFVYRLTNPLDRFLSAPGQSAAEQVFKTGAKTADYAARALEDPSMVRDDVAGALHKFHVEQSPFASPAADTLGGEFRRTFGVGMNNGELLFDVGSTVVGAGAIKGAVGLGRAAKAVTAAEEAYLAANPGFAARLAEQYSGMSHHIIPRGATLPAWLGGGKYPEWLIESEFNKIAHEGMTTRDVFRNHVGVDDSYYGGKVRVESGNGRWSGKRDLGWERYGPIDRLRYGTSPYTKAVVGPILLGGTATDAFSGEGR
jgi:hypothetical protein